MRAVGIKQLKNKLSTYVHLAAGGETVLVTDRDRVVAELVPPRGPIDLVISDDTAASTSPVTAPRSIKVRSRLVDGVCDLTTVAIALLHC